MTAPKGMALGSPRLGERMKAWSRGPDTLLGRVADAWIGGRPVSGAAAMDARTTLTERVRLEEALGTFHPHAVHARLTLRLYDREMAPPKPKRRGKR